MTKTKSTLDICGKDHWPLKQDHLENTSKRQAQWQKTSKTFLRVVFCVLYTFKPIKDWTRNKKPRVLVEIDNRFCSDLFPKIKLPLLPVSPHAGFFSLPAFRSHQHYRTDVIGVRHGWQRSYGCVVVTYSNTSLRSIKAVFWWPFWKQRHDTYFGLIFSLNCEDPSTSPLNIIKILCLCRHEGSCDPVGEIFEARSTPGKLYPELLEIHIIQLFQHNWWCKWYN